MKYCSEKAFVQIIICTMSSCLAESAKSSGSEPKGVSSSLIVRNSLFPVLLPNNQGILFIEKDQ